MFRLKCLGLTEISHICWRGVFAGVFPLETSPAAHQSDIDEMRIDFSTYLLNKYAFCTSNTINAYFRVVYAQNTETT